MILSVKITLEELSRNGKSHKWGPHFCEDCCRNMWGHGYVQRYFSESSHEVFVKRYRCPGCGCVVTVRPHGYWVNLRSSIFTIYEALKAKLAGLWPPGFPRQRGGHWLCRFSQLAQMENQMNLSSFLEHCFSKEIQFLA